MRTIVRTLFGSKLYGTSTPTSDTDYKSVHLPASEDMLLHRTKDVLSFRTKVDNATKNTSEDVDDESFALHRYFNLLEKGESIAIEVLFAPESHILLKTPEWDAIQAVRHRLVSKECKGFTAYCQRQAAKYGVKGSRVAATRAALELVNRWIHSEGEHQKLGYLVDELRPFVVGRQHTSLVEIPQANGTMLTHWEVCDRKLPLTVSLKECHHVLTKVFENYGARSLQAETNQGVDWKAMSHAVRVGYQAIELLNTGELTFPRFHAPHLLDIKLGRLPYKQVEEELEWLLEGIELAVGTSTLPDTFDRAFADSIVLDLYENQVLEGPGVPIDWWPARATDRIAA